VTGKRGIKLERILGNQGAFPTLARHVSSEEATESLVHKRVPPLEWRITGIVGRGVGGNSGHESTLGPQKRARDLPGASV